MTFSSLGLSRELLKTIEEQGYHTPHPVQTEVIPHILKGHDLLAISKTGQGKTAAFTLPILQLLQQRQQPGTRMIKALIIAASRERAGKVGFSIHKYSNHLGLIKTKVIFGGVAINMQMKGLRGTDILAATPERLAELIKKEVVDLSQAEMLVIDEADELLKLDCAEALESILSLLPEKRQNMIFTAENNKEVQSLADRLLNDPVTVEIEEEDTAPTIRQQAYIVEPEKKDSLLCRLVGESDWPRVLIFTSFAKRADQIAMKLMMAGIQADAVYGDKSERMRSAILERFETGQLRALVITDLISRTIEIKSIPCVVSYELPGSAISYIHRISRLDQSDSKALSVALVKPDEIDHLKLIEKKVGAAAEPVDTSGMDL